MLTALLFALATAASPALASNHLKIKGNEFNLCIDNPNGSQNNGNPLQFWTCIRGNTNQAWTFSQVPQQPTKFYLGEQANNAGKCLGVAQPNNNNLNNAPVVLAPCTGPGYLTWFYRTGDYMCLLGSNWCVQPDDTCPDDGTGLKIAWKANPPALQFFDYTTPAN